jgi:hypothetical protein
MTIEQKAREIALIVAEDGGVPWSQEPYAAARLGIIEGLEMADQKLKVLMLGLPMHGPKAQALLEASTAIHALAGEKR